MEDANLHGGWLTAWGRPAMGAQFRLTLPRKAGAILETSPLPLVPRDLVGPGAPGSTVWRRQRLSPHVPGDSWLSPTTIDRCEDNGEPLVESGPASLCGHPHRPSQPAGCGRLREYPHLGTHREGGGTATWVPELRER